MNVPPIQNPNGRTIRIEPIIQLPTYSPSQGRLRYYMSLSLTFILLIALFIKQQYINIDDPEGDISDTRIKHSVQNLTVSDLHLQDRIYLKPFQPSLIDQYHFNQWIEKETDIARTKILKNIKHSNDQIGWDDGHIPLGVVAASPSRESPNYYFQWTRDSAMTLNALVWDYKEYGTSVNPMIHDIMFQYFNNSIFLQRLRNWSGNFSIEDKYKGLAEPKYNIDSTPFNDNWGRPQNDGPALRIITVLNYLDSLKSESLTINQLSGPYHSYNFQNESDLLTNFVYFDIQFIVLNYQESCFDLWEEITDRHFFTTIVQFYALSKSIDKWVTFSEEYGNYPNNDSNLFGRMKETYNELLQFLVSKDNFINIQKGYLVESPNLLRSRSGIDIAILLGSIVSHPSRDSMASSIPFDVDDSGVLNTLYSLIKSMSVIYPINHPKIPSNMGVALGRYPEDVYDGLHTSEGNPWFISTSTAAELMYILIERYHTEKRPIVINFWKTKFWKLFFHEQSNGYYWDDDLTITMPYNSLAFNITLSNIFKYGDSFLDVVRTHMSDEGEMSEQFNKYTGFLQGANDLSWSYSSFLDAVRSRANAQKLLEQ